MSKWTDIRDSVVDALNVDVVTEDMKNELTQNIVTNAIPPSKLLPTNSRHKFRNRVNRKQDGICSETVLSYRWSLMELSGQ